MQADVAIEGMMEGCQRAVNLKIVMNITIIQDVIATVNHGQLLQPRDMRYMPSLDASK